MKRVTRLLWPVLLAGMVVGVYQLKAQVEEREKELARVQRAIDEERETIQVLRAEWSYLNKPERLRRLATAKLELQPMGAKQVASFERMAQRLAEAAPVETAAREAALPEGMRSR
jgi:cell division protein FtsL